MSAAWVVIIDPIYNAATAKDTETAENAETAEDARIAENAEGTKIVRIVSNSHILILILILCQRFSI